MENTDRNQWMFSEVENLIVRADTLARDLRHFKARLEEHLKKPIKILTDRESREAFG